MTTEEAREAAWDDDSIRLEFYDSPVYGANWDRWDMFDTEETVKWIRSIHDAGVASGIRQAREAAEAGFGELAGSSAPTTPNAQTWMKAGASRAIAKIDALGGEQ